MISTASVALATMGSFPSRLVVLLLVPFDGIIRAQTVPLSTSLVHPVVAALGPVVVILAPFVCALALAEVALALALALAIGTVPGYVTVSSAGPEML